MNEMTTPTDTEKLTQALREKIARLRVMKRGEMYLAAQIFADDLERILAAHDSRAQPEVKPVYVLDRYGFPVGASQYRLERMADGYWTPWHIAQQTLSETIARMQYQFDKALESRARAQPASHVTTSHITASDPDAFGYSHSTFLGVPPAQPASVADHTAKLTAVVKWLESNQPDVFRRGLWDAINAAAPQPAKSVCNRDCDCVGECKAGVE